MKRNLFASVVLELKDRVPTLATSRQMTKQEWKQVGAIVQQDRKPDGEYLRVLFILYQPLARTVRTTSSSFRAHTVTAECLPVDPISSWFCDLGLTSLRIKPPAHGEHTENVCKP